VDKLLGGGGDVCPAVLAAARGGKVPQETQAAPSKPANPTLPNPEAVLRNLFR
jgi:hypothetical protein